MITGIWATFTTAVLTEPSSIPGNPPRPVATNHDELSGLCLFE